MASCKFFVWYQKASVTAKDGSPKRVTLKQPVKLMKTSRFRWTIPCLTLMLGLSAVALSPRSGEAATGAFELSKAAAQIDAYVLRALDEEGQQRNAEADDATFARRIFLDVAGRIPTYQELESFLRSESADKRGALIDELLDSEGYASNFYNYWEDVLRIQSRGRKTVMVSYQDWVKQSLKENKPYDEFVRDLIASSGFVWDDPAVGYYLRDAGMPLDNMSNTAQVFLGTRMQCAQCHDHPFDSWTQKEYYHMAAFTFGVDSADNSYRKAPEFLELLRVARQVRRTEAQQGSSGRDAADVRMGSLTERRVIRDIYEPLGMEVTIADKQLKLPEDYAYDNGKPNQVMAAKTPFGPDAKVGKRDDPQQVYANWLTSPENPRFTKTIANRLWKKAMGVGLIEPVDDLKDDTQASHPELMSYLEELMVASGYDMKAYLRTIFNTRTYQSEAYAGDVVADERYLYTGPSLRRMSAEQLWDSVLALSLPDLDQSIGSDAPTTALRVRELEMKDHVEKVKQLDGREMYAAIRYLGEMQTKFIALEKDLLARMNAADDAKARNTLRLELRNLRSEQQKGIDTVLAKISGTEVFNRREAMAEMQSDGYEMDGDKAKGKEGRKLAQARKNLVRASEIVSPAPPGHFLRQFGESDREIIESSSDEAAIPQALSLLNGNLFNVISNPNSALSKELQGLEGEQRLDVLFKSFFGRAPTERERELVGEQVASYGFRKGYNQVVLAMLNSQEFRFIQ